MYAPVEQNIFRISRLSDDLFHKIKFGSIISQHACFFNSGQDRNFAVRVELQ